VTEGPTIPTAARCRLAHTEYETPRSLSHASSFAWLEKTRPPQASADGFPTAACGLTVPVRVRTTCSQTEEEQSDHDHEDEEIYEPSDRQRAAT